MILLGGNWSAGVLDGLSNVENYCSVCFFVNLVLT